MIAEALSFRGRCGRRAFLAVWAAATALLFQLGTGAPRLIAAVDRLGAPDVEIALLAAGLILLAGYVYLFPLLSVSVRRARDLGGSAAVCGMVIGVELTGLVAHVWAEGHAFWVFGLFNVAVFLILALWPGTPEDADRAPAWALA